MTMRERMARAVYTRRTGGCLVPFDEQGGLTRDSIYADVDTMLDCLTAPPTSAMILAACEEARKEQCRPVSINRIDAAMVWETMVRTMIQEGK